MVRRGTMCMIGDGRTVRLDRVPLLPGGHVSLRQRRSMREVGKGLVLGAFGIIKYGFSMPFSIPPWNKNFGTPKEKEKNVHRNIVEKRKIKFCASKPQTFTKH